MEWPRRRHQRARSPWWPLDNNNRAAQPLTVGAFYTWDGAKLNRVDSVTGRLCGAFLLAPQLQLTNTTLITHQSAAAASSRTYCRKRYAPLRAAKSQFSCLKVGLLSHLGAMKPSLAEQGSSKGSAGRLRGLPRDLADMYETYLENGAEIIAVEASHSRQTVLAMRRDRCF